MMIVGDAVGTTVTEFETVCVFPAVSVNVALMLYVPDAAYTWVTVVFDEIDPRSCVDPSPQSRWTFRTASPAGSVPMPIVNVAGSAAPGGVVGGVMLMLSAVGFTVTAVAALTTFPELSVSVPVSV